MRYLYPILLFVTESLAANIQVVWRLEKDTNASSLSALGTDGTIVAEICGSIIHGKSTIDFSQVNENGTGNFTIGDSSFMIHSKPEWSGGPACSRVFNPEYTLVQCSGVAWDSEGVVKDKAKDCFGNSHTEGELKSLEKRSQHHEMHTRDAELEERQYQCSSWTTSPRLVGNGDPHQNYFHKQLSENINCANAQSCSVGKTDSESFTIGFSVSAGGPGSVWFSGGFSVSASWTTGNSYTCNGGPGETICIWYNIAHTAYTVQEWSSNPCSEGHVSGSPYVMFSPNDNNKGGGYYCVVGSCRSKGEGYWDYNGRAGGP